MTLREFVAALQSPDIQRYHWFFVEETYGTGPKALLIRGRLKCDTQKKGSVKCPLTALVREETGVDLPVGDLPESARLLNLSRDALLRITLACDGWSREGELARYDDVFPPDADGTPSMSVLRSWICESLGLNLSDKPEAAWLLEAA